MLQVIKIGKNRFISLARSFSRLRDMYSYGKSLHASRLPCVCSKTVARMSANDVFIAAVMERSCDIVHIDVDGVHTNLVLITMTKPGLSAQTFCDELQQVMKSDMGVSREAPPLEFENENVRCCFLVKYLAFPE